MLAVVPQVLSGAKGSFGQMEGKNFALGQTIESFNRKAAAARRADDQILVENRERIMGAELLTGSARRRVG